MKPFKLSFLFFMIGLLACQQAEKNQPPPADSLQRQSAPVYKPGLGEFMSAIQVHHAKLWFAGQNNNWPLAAFETGEIKESLDDIKTFCTDRPEIKSIGMIDPPLDSLNHAIAQKDAAQFRSSYMLLTNTCNNCHRATNHAFNVIKVPDSPPFSNQDFKVH